MPENENHSARLAELEVKMAFAEDMIETLNRTVFRQQEQIELLQREMQHLYRQLQEAASNERGEPRDEIPPHY